MIRLQLALFRMAECDDQRSLPWCVPQAGIPASRSLCTHVEVLSLLGNFDDYSPEPSLDALLCSHAALACFMHAKTFEGAVLSAINLRGDADTVGACTGALAGAYWGLRAIPCPVEKQTEGDASLVALGEKLWQARMK